MSATGGSTPIDSTTSSRSDGDDRAVRGDRRAHVRLCPARLSRPLGRRRRGRRPDRARGARAGTRRPGRPQRQSRACSGSSPSSRSLTDAGRIAYGPVTPDDVDSPRRRRALRRIGRRTRCARTRRRHRMAAHQQRVTFARVGVIDPLSLDDYHAHGGGVGLRRALEMTPHEVVAEVMESGLRGRGGAGFPAGIKWQTVLDAEADRKYVCCNADEGDSGTFADRMLMEGDPFTLIEGMLITSYAVGARPRIHLRPLRVPRRRRDAQLRDRDPVRPRLARRATCSTPTTPSTCPCASAPAPTSAAKRPRCSTASKASAAWSAQSHRSLPSKGCSASRRWSTTCSTLGSVPAVLADSGAAYAATGFDRSLGTQVFQLAGNIARGGIVETAFGITLDELVNGYGGGTRTGRPIRALQVGGPLGAYIPADQLDLRAGYESLAASRGDDRPRRNRRLRRHCRHGPAGQIRDGVLRRGVVRQVHAVPGRLRPAASR